MKHVKTLILVIVCGAAVVVLAQTTMPTTQPTAAAPATRPAAAPLTVVAQTTQPSTMPGAVVQNNQNNQNNQNGNNQFGNNQNGGNRFGRGRRNGNNGFNNFDNSATTGPASVADNITIPFPNPLPYDVDQVVSYRNIFIRGGQHTVPPGTGTGGGGPTNPTPIANSLVFVGAVETNNQPTAYIEDLSNEVVTLYKVGTALGEGKITAISLDSLDYSLNGNLLHITLGQTLSGNNAWSLLYGISTAATSEPPTGANADVLAKMMARRQAEMSQIAGVKVIPGGESAPATQPSPAAAPAGAPAGATTNPAGLAR